MARPKSPPKPQIDRPRSWQDADRLVGLMARTEGEIAVLQAEADRRIQVESAALAARLAPRQELLEALGQAVETFAVGHKADFEGARSLALAHGRVGWRQTPPAVKYLRPMEEIVATLEDRKLDVAILTTKRISKEVLATWGEPLLRELGIRLTQRDDFYVEYAEAPASEAPTG